MGYKLLLADDDADDRIFFQEVLEEMPFNSTLTMVNDGEKLMELLSEMDSELPDIIFLDLNMPRKTGLQCLTEIRRDKRFGLLPVIVYSTSFIPEVVDELYAQGAHYYIRKPGEYAKLRETIHEAILLVSPAGKIRPAREHFILGA